MLHIHLKTLVQCTATQAGGAVDGAVMFSTIVIFPLHSKWQRISSGIKSPQALRDLCLCSSTREPKDMTCDCSPAQRMEVPKQTSLKKRKQDCLTLALYMWCKHIHKVHMYTCEHMPCILCFSTSFWLSHPTYEQAHASDTTIPTAMCTVNFKELKRRFLEACQSHMSSGTCVRTILRLLSDLFIRD